MSDHTSSSTATQIAQNSTFERFARAGYVVSGLLHLTIGYLAIRLALGSGGNNADQSGALSAVAAKPGGIVALWVAVLAFLVMALWRLVETGLGRKTDPKSQAASSEVLDRVNLECDMVGKYVARAAELAGLHVDPPSKSNSPRLCAIRPASSPVTVSAAKPPRAISTKNSTSTNRSDIRRRRYRVPWRTLFRVTCVSNLVSPARHLRRRPRAHPRITRSARRSGSCDKDHSTSRSWAEARRRSATGICVRGKRCALFRPTHVGRSRRIVRA